VLTYPASEYFVIGIVSRSVWISGATEMKAAPQVFCKPANMGGICGISPQHGEQRENLRLAGGDQSIRTGGRFLDSEGHLTFAGKEKCDLL
jgi:hypothetical protein